MTEWHRGTYGYCNIQCWKQKLGADDYFPNLQNPDYSYLILIYGPIYYMNSSYNIFTLFEKIGGTISLKSLLFFWM